MVYPETKEQFIEDNKNVIESLNEKFEGYVANDVDELKIKEFLLQFERLDMHAGLALLRNIDYYTSNDTLDLTRSLGNLIRKKIHGDFSNVHFCPTDESTGTSSDIVLRKLRHVLHLGGDQHKGKFVRTDYVEKLAIDLESKINALQSQIDVIENLPETEQEYANPLVQIRKLQLGIEKLRSDPLNTTPKTIIFVDDFVGSGRSFAKFLEEGLGSWYNPLHTYFLATLIAHEQGISRIEELHIKVIPVIKIPDSKKIFHEENTLFTEIQKMTLKKYCDRLKLLELFRYGYDNSQSNVIFSEGSSNNILPILYYDKKRWIPLFPRIG